VWALEVGQSLEALHPHGVLLIVDREERNRHVCDHGEAALTQRRENYVRHLLDGVVKLTSDDDSCPWHRGVKGYLHPDLAHVQAMDIGESARRSRDR
jgi:hypothetical protein